MQMSNFRVRGKLSMTYEPALARIFKDGRTETIRSCTPAAAAFIHEMSSENVDKGQFEIKMRRPIDSLWQQSLIWITWSEIHGLF